MLGVHTKAQQAKNANAGDSSEKFYEDMMKVSQGKGDKALPATWPSMPTT